MVSPAFQGHWYELQGYVRRNRMRLSCKKRQAKVHSSTRMFLLCWCSLFGSIQNARAATCSSKYVDLVNILYFSTWVVAELETFLLKKQRVVRTVLE